MPEIKISVILIEHEKQWSAQCLQYDIGAQANTLSDVVYELNRSLAGYMAICEELGVAPFANLSAAPQMYWDMASKASRIDSFGSDSIPFRTPAPIPSYDTDYRVIAA